MRVLPVFVLSLLAAAAFAQESEESCPPRYSYCGYSGPAQWPNLPIEKNACGGAKQSPIDLVAQKPTPGDAIKVEYKAGDATIWNTGHDIRVVPNGDAGGIRIGEKFYPLVNFHFHSPSEHRIPGVSAQAEIHLVHQLGNEYAVIGVILTAGLPYEALVPVFANLPVKACTRRTAKIDFDKILPKELSSYYAYVGSLTTPPCTEGVNWYVLDGARTIGAPDLAKLGALGPNARPLQRNPKPLDVTYIRPK
jgi:carbonic anhydrase